MGLASLVLSGWSFEIPTLTSFVPGFAVMKVTTAFGFLFAGTSVLWLNASQSVGASQQSRYIQPALPAVVAGLFGLGTLIVYAAGLVPNTDHPAWMSPSTAVSFVLFAIAAVTFQSETRAVQRISEAALLLMVWMSALAVVGYLYNARSLYTFKPYVSIALPTALSFVFIGMALLFVRPDRGFMAIVLSPETGGLMLRRIVPLTLAMVVVIGSFRLAGEITGTFGHVFSLTAVVGLSMAGFGLVLWIVARHLNGVEKEWSESRIRLQLAKDAADLGIHDYDVIHGTIRWDDRVRELWGVGATEPITIDTFWDGVHSEDRAVTKDAIDRALNPDSDGRYVAEFRVVHRTEKQTRWIEAAGRAIFERGRAVRLVGTVQDITDRKQAEEVLKETQSRLLGWNVELEQVVTDKTIELLRSQERLRALASELSLAEHRERKRLATDLHDHLQQMLVYGKMMIGQGKRRIADVPAAAEVMTKVDDVLSEALTYSRTLVAELSPLVLQDHGLAAGLKWLADYMRKYGQTVTVLVPDKHQLKLPEAHRVLLFQSVRELLINASKHAGTGKATVCMEQREKNLYVIVSDEGKGFDPAAVAAAGIPSSGISSKFGLFSIDERMRALGGSFLIESSPGHGTAATLVLPLARDTEGAAESPAMPGTSLVRSAASGEKSVARIKGRTIVPVLLVDDHAMVRQGLRAVLDAYDDLLVVAEAQDGAEALKLVGDLHPRVVVMDINMPRMNGIDATARIKTQWPETTVIGISVNTGDDTSEAMKRAGAATVLPKDTAVDRLHDLIVQEVGISPDKFTSPH